MGKKQAAVTTTTDNPLANLSADLQALLAQNADQGLEDVGPEGYSIPFLKLLQGLSPEVQAGTDEEVEGARSGLIMDSVTQDLFDEVEVIPVHIRSAVIEWTPRHLGGGFVAEYANREEAEESVTPGNELKDTITYTVLYRPLGDLAWRQALLAMESTKLRIARNWNTQLNMLRIPITGEDGEIITVNPPIYATRWLLGTTRQENAKGKFFNYQVRNLGLVEEVPLIQQAQELRAAVEGRPLRGKDGDLEEPEVGEGGDDNF